MKFAEYLKENLVPEWKDKYLDYKGGKKKIKKITGSPKFMAKTLSNVTPKLPSSGRFTEFRFQQQDHRPSFSLPPAAFDSNAKDQDEDNQKNDRTPLLQSLNPPAVRNESINEVLVSENHDGLIHRRPQGTPKIDTLGDQASPLTEGVAMNNSYDTNSKEFIEWLDSELEKIDTFYREKEAHAVERFLLLQDQMYHLREEKIRFFSKDKVQHEEILRTGLAKTTREFYKINKYELPSLPKLDLGKTNGSINEANNKRDYEHHKHETPYYVARRQLKSAVQEFYRALELLKSYRMLNRTGFRKLLKKFDKQTESLLSQSYMQRVNASYFASSDVLDNLFPKVEELFSSYFENGNRKIAVEKLRSNLNEAQFYPSVFLSGLFYGVSIPLLAYSIYLGIYKTLTGKIPEGRFILQIWGGFLLILLIAILFGFNCLVWAKYKVNYRFIFEFNPRTALNYRQYYLIPSVFVFLLAIFSWFSFNDFWPERLPAKYWPWFFFGSSFVALLFPYNVFFFESRKWLIVTMWRLFFSGFYPVEFRDFFTGDIFCSLTYTMGNISFFFCMYATHWRGAVEGDSKCGSSKSRLMGFFSTLPVIWRFLQCLRRYADSGDWFPHLANMAKYSCSIVYYVTLSVYRIDSSQTTRGVFIFFAIINSIYSTIWDILMDWSLMQNKYLLRDDLIYSHWFYYFAIVSNVILRFQWIFYALFSQQIQQSAVTSFLVAIAEIVRRFIWIFIRMENEHITNSHLYRASREAPLPYETLIRHEQRGSNQTVPDADTVGYDSIRTDTERQSVSNASRRNTIINSVVFQNVTRAIVNAHMKDFQRRKDDDNIAQHENNSSDDENSDEDPSLD